MIQNTVASIRNKTIKLYYVKNYFVKIIDLAERLLSAYLTANPNLTEDTIINIIRDVLPMFIKRKLASVKCKEVIEFVKCVQRYEN